MIANAQRQLKDCINQPSGHWAQGCEGDRPDNSEFIETLPKRGYRFVAPVIGNILNVKFPYIAAALKELPDNTILDGELVALDSTGRSVFNLLRNFRSAEAQIHYYAFDILALRGKDLTQRPLAERRVILSKVAPVNDHVSLSAVSPGPTAEILDFVKKHGLEGVVAKRADSPAPQAITIANSSNTNPSLGWTASSNASWLTFKATQPIKRRSQPERRGR